MKHRPAIVIRASAIAAAAAFVVLWFKEPRPHSWARPLSAYALSDRRPLWQLAIGLTALTAILLARRPFAIHRDVKARSLYAAAAGLIALALIPTDPWFPWEHLPTLHGAIHVLATAFAMGGFGIFTLIVAATDTSSWRRVLAATYALGLSVTVATVLLMIILGKSPQFIGLAEWILLTLALINCAAV